MKITRTSRYMCSGQVMAEACIGLALMVFAWIIISYSLFMGDNQIRTGMAARHAAWRAGTNPDLLKDMPSFQNNIDTDFFYQNGITIVTQLTPYQRRGNGATKAEQTVAQALTGGDDGPYLMQVQFGMSNDQVTNTTVFPFVLMNTHVPFMPDSFLANCTSVSSTCQWGEVGETWTDQGTAFQKLGSYILNAVTEGVKGVGNAIVSLFNSIF